jgi:hypothetical protein
MSPAIFRICKIVSVIGGSVVSIIGMLWSLVIVNSLSDEARTLKDIKDGIVKEIASLNNAASEYFIANQQGDLIFVLANQGNARQDIVTLIYKGNMLDRATPVRNMIGALAFARQLDYRQNYNGYERLNDEARQTMSFPTFTMLKNREKEIITQAQNLVPTLLNQQFEISKELNANEAAQKSQRNISGVFSILGTLLLLVANLIAKRGGNREYEDQ